MIILTFLVRIKISRTQPLLLIPFYLQYFTQYIIINNSMDLQGLVVKKGLKGKQNKKKWNKNIDVSGLFDKMQQQGIEQTRKKYAKPLIVEDTTKKIRQQLDPNRFKNRIKSQPKKVYDNSFKRDNLISDGMQDVWNDKIESTTHKKQELIVPAIIKPSSGHSYNPRKQDIEQIVDEVIDYEKQRPRKMKKIKKLKDVKVIPRTRNKKLRRQYLQARQRKIERETLNQIHSAKKIKRQIQEKQKKILEKIENKQKEREDRLKQSREGKVRQGPKLGKKRYIYKQYIPKEEQIGKKISHVSQSNQLMKEQFDSIFRRGILEPRNVKVHANKTKNIKVIERFEEDE